MRGPAWIRPASSIGSDTPALVCSDNRNGANASSRVTVDIPSLSLSLTAIAPVVVSLGRKIHAIDLARHVRGGSAPFTYSLVSQTMPHAVACSLNGSVLASDYAYRSGVNTITVQVTDSNRAHVSTTIRVKVDVPTVAYQVYGIDFSPYANGQDFNSKSDIGTDQITQRIGNIAPYTRWIRSFRSTLGQEHIGTIAHKFGLKVCMGAWITSDSSANATEMSNLIAHAQRGEADCAIVGSEVLYRNDVKPARLIGYIDQFRAAVPNVPVTAADDYHSLLNTPQVVKDCDFVFVNYYPYWEGEGLSGAIAYLNAEDALLRRTYPDKEVIVSETGWPSAGNTVGNGISSPENAASYFLNFESWARSGQRKSFYFEAFDEDWKATPNAPQQARFGVFDQDGVIKYGSDVFSGKTLPDNWTCKKEPGGKDTATIALTSVPPIGSNSVLRGQVSHVAPANYFVVVYIHSRSVGWWVKPYATSPLSLINCDGTWTTNIVTGRNDAFADQIAVFLIPSTYDPAILRGAQTLPPELYGNSVAHVLVRSRAPRKAGIEEERTPR
ncbi:MAG: glycosyl hydrolase family 17 protein [Candidatus Acidiferrales bacterium]|jgi:exo-beta-1,3-glucanase (GH17 family)